MNCLNNVWFEIDERQNHYKIDYMDKFSEEHKRDLDKNNETLPSFLRPVNN